MNKRYFVRVLLAAWIFVWAWFAVRAYFRYNLLEQHIKFTKMPSLEAKRASVTGEDLYAFIKFCEGSIPACSTYEFMGLGNDVWAYRRVLYYLYPNTIGPSPEYLLIYKMKDYNKDGYRLFKALTDDKYILIKASV